MARKINAVSPNESRLNEFFADPERRNTSNFRGISYEDERRAHANEIYESGTKWVNEQLESGGGSGGGGAQPDWNAAEGEPGHILNRTHNWVEATGEVYLRNLVSDGEMGYAYTGDPIKLIPGEQYGVKLGGTGDATTYNCTAIDLSAMGMNACALGNIGALTGEGDTGEPFIVIVAPGYSALGGAFCAQIVELTGATPTYVYITGKHFKPKKIDRAWLPIPNVASVVFDVRLDINNVATVGCNYTTGEIKQLTLTGCVICASARVFDYNGNLRNVIGLNINTRNDDLVKFGNAVFDEDWVYCTIHEISVPFAGSAISYSVVKKQYSVVTG